MATMERPKIKKKKKTKTQLDDDNDVEKLQSIPNLELPSTSSSSKYDNIISHDCFVSAQYQSTIVENESHTTEHIDDRIDDLETKTENVNKIESNVPNIEKYENSENKQVKANVLNENDNFDVIKNIDKDENSETKQVKSNALNDENSDMINELNNACDKELVVNKESCEKEIVVENLQNELIAATSEIKTGSPHPWTHNLEEPTAPSIDRSVQRSKLAYVYDPIAKYPNLDSIRRHEENLQTQNFYQQMSTTTNTRQIANIIRPSPLTSSQLKEIYCCHEIEMVKQFELEFLTNTLKENYEIDPLYILLKQYALARNKLRINLMHLENIKTRLNNVESKIWETHNETIQYSGKCADKQQVRGTEIYKIAEINSNALHAVVTDLNKIYELVCFSITTNNISAEISKLKIEQIVREILSYQSFEKINTNTPIVFNKSFDNDTLHSMCHLRRVISILFCFIRKPFPDKIFSDDLKNWLTNLIALYLRVATVQDHWFVLFHILRCPSGVSSWATSFLQIPNPISINNNKNILQSAEINHCMSILYILLMPIKKRNEFLSALAKSHKDISDPIKEDIWILVDSDGEEDSTANGECVGLKENDFIMFLNQIPLEMIFRSAINAQKTSNDYIIHNDSISENQLIKLIAFNTNLIELFGEGLLTYNTERYKQFAKRLGRLIRHTIQYVSDSHELFIRSNASKDPYLCERISVELNSFIIKACSYIYKTPNLATWQYFASLPFEVLDSDTVWQLFYYLNIGFPDHYPIASDDCKENLKSPNFWERFKVSTSDLSSEDMYYLIQTFFEMANERDRIKDWEFIQKICTHIFTIGFVNESTREMCYKSCRDMLTNLTLNHPELIEVLLNQLRSQFNQTENIIYLFKSLPLENWKTDIQSFEILSTWLLNYNYEHSENILARVIISHLNWGFDANNRLFLPHNIHVRMACLICEALHKHSPETIGVSGISESVRQVSSFIENQTTKEQFTTWCWNMVSLLRLHLMDQNGDGIRKALVNPSEHLCFVPDLENFNIIFQGVSENRPLAMYISILISLWGHSIPLICQKGLPQMKSLLIDYRHQTVIRCIQLITPLFLECPETLSQCESFQEILKLILNSDRTYLKMMKDLVTANSPGPVFELFHNMILSQIINYIEFGFPTPTPLIIFWLKILTSIPNWQNINVVLLIDSIIKIAYQFPESWWSSKEFFRLYYVNCDDWKSDRSTTLKIFFGSSKENRNFPTLSSECGWLALVLLELEHDLQECNTRIWPEFVRQLLNNPEKHNMEYLLKKTCTTFACQPFPLSSLVLYKYANLISQIDINHPLFPIFNQKFFSLYLVRVDFNNDDERFQHTFGVADQFYEQNITLMKKLKLKLKQAEEFYVKESAGNIESETLTYFYTQCAKMMKTFLLWLEETNINKISKDQHIDLPPQYNIEKLQQIFNQHNQHWTEFLYPANIRKEQIDLANKWLRICFRINSTKRRSGDPLATKPKTTPIERIKKHLISYDNPLEPPILQKNTLILNPLQAKDINSGTLKLLRNELKSIEETSKKFNLTIKEVNSLNSNYKELIPMLYKNIAYCEDKTVKCSTIFSNECTGPAIITVELKRPQKIESIQRKIDENRERYGKIIEQILQQNIDKLVLSMQKIEHIVRCLLTSQIELQDKKSNKNNIADVAVEYFYDVLKNINENIQTMPPCDDLCQSIIQDLGIFIQNNQETQGIKILETSLKRPELLKLLAELFVPSRTEAEYFLNMYKFLIDSHMRRCDTKVLFVLMSKFDLPNWLQGTHPKLSEINRLLKLILTGLENWNQPETNILQDLFRRHLVHIFNHDFPEHYGEVLQIVLNSVSEQKISAIVLLDLLNSLLLQCGCEALDTKSKTTKINEEILKFSTQQNLFNFKSVTDTIGLFARHFQNERLQHGLHGLYPKHKNYCQPLAIWFSCLSQTAVVIAICSYPGELADQICDWIFAPIIDMYSPWLVIYKEQDLQKSTANWIKQFITNGKILYPWSELHTESAQILIQSFITSLQYILESLPVSGIILGHIFSWYHYHFASLDVGNYIRSPIHMALVKLPWNRFYPQPVHIESYFKLLHEFLPECHSFLGHIFLRVDWSKWHIELFQNWNFEIQNHVIYLLHTIFVEISFEPHLHDNPKTSEILEIGCNEFPWHLITLKGIESTFNWLLLSVEPVIILKMPSESNAVDLSVLKLLQITSGMCPGKKLNNPESQITAKQILYTRTIVRMLRACSSKHQKLLATPDGLQSYRNTIVELLNTIDQIVGEGNATRDKEIDSQNMVSEIIGSLQSQSEFTAKLFVDAIIYWQSNCNIGSPVLYSTLNSIGFCKTFIVPMYSLIETTIYNYFRFADNSPTWKSVFRRLGKSLDNLDLMILLQGSYLLTLHAFILYKIQNLTNIDDKIKFLQDLSQLLETVKTNEQTEGRAVIVWGAIITCGCEILAQTDKAKKQLLMLARYLQVISKQSEGWSESILGAIGFKTKGNKRKILTRCLSSMIFILFPDNSGTIRRPSQEFCLSLDDLKNECNSKNNADLKMITINALKIIEDNHFPQINEVTVNIFNIIELFYNDIFIKSVPDVWHIEKCL